jgi:hypothetical protein
MFRRRRSWVAFVPALLASIAAAAVEDRRAPIPITTSSEEARALFLQGRDANYAYVRRDAQRFLERARAGRGGAEVASEKGG